MTWPGPPPWREAGWVAPLVPEWLDEYRAYFALERARDDEASRLWPAETGGEG